MRDQQKPGSGTTARQRWSRFAWLLIVIVDAGSIAWGAMAALAPSHLPGPGGRPILTTEYEGFTGNSWAIFNSTSPVTADFMTVLFRMYGTYNVAFGLLAVAIAATAFRRGERWAWWALLVSNTIAYGSAIAFDRIVRAIGVFELSEYLGIGLVYLALALTVPHVYTRKLRNKEFGIRN